MIMSTRPYSSKLRTIRRRLREHKYWRPRLAAKLARTRRVQWWRKWANLPTNGS